MFDACSIYAIGDCIEGPMLAHKAEDEGILFLLILLYYIMLYISYNLLAVMI